MLHDESTYTSTQNCDKPALLVLGSGVLSNGQPGPILKQRLDKTIELYQSTPGVQVIVSGDGMSKSSSETSVMRQYIERRGVKTGDTKIDEEGFDTMRSCANAAKIVGAQTPLVIVTQPIHANRASWLCQSVGFENVTVAPASGREIFNREFLASYKAFAEGFYSRLSSIN